MAQSDSVPARAGEYKHQITATIEREQNIWKKNLKHLNTFWSRGIKKCVHTKVKHGRVLDWKYFSWE